MTRSAGRIAVAIALLTAGLRWVIDSNPWSGPLVIRLSPTHGVHVNDWLSIVLWTGAVLSACPAWVSSAAAVVPIRARRGQSR